MVTPATSVSIATAETTAAAEPNSTPVDKIKVGRSVFYGQIYIVL